MSGRLPNNDAFTRFHLNHTVSELDAKPPLPHYEKLTTALNEKGEVVGIGDMYFLNYALRGAPEEGCAARDHWAAPENMG